MSLGPLQPVILINPGLQIARVCETSQGLAYFVWLPKQLQQCTLNSFRRVTSAEFRKTCSTRDHEAATPESSSSSGSSGVNARAGRAGSGALEAFLSARLRLHKPWLAKISQTRPSSPGGPRSRSATYPRCTSERSAASPCTYADLSPEPRTDPTTTV